MALALGFNIAVAQEWNTGGEATDDSTQLQWEVVGGFFAPAFQSQTDTTSINNLNFIFGKTGVTTEQWSKNTNSATITLKYGTHDFTIKNNQADKGIQIGANGGGTLSVEFAQGSKNNGAGARTFTINSTGKTGDTHFKGNIQVASSNGSASNLNKLIITLGNGNGDLGKLDGRLSIVAGGNMETTDSTGPKGSPQISFTNNTEITNGIWVTGGFGKVIFDQEAKVNDSSDLGAGETLYTNDTTLDLLFKGSATIKNELNNGQTGGNYAFISTSNNTNNGITATFNGTTNTIEGNIGAGAKNNSDNNGVTNTLTLNGDTNTINGNIIALTSGQATNNIILNGSQSNAINKERGK